MEQVTIPGQAQVTVSSEGQISIPKDVLDTLHLAGGAQLTLQLRGQEIILSKDPAWMSLEGAASDDPGFVDKFSAMRKDERERENARI